MSNTFTNYKAKNVGTTPVVMVTAAAATQTTAIGLSLANTSLSPISVSGYVTNAGVNYYFINGATVAPGGCLNLFGGDGKLTLITGDAFTVVSSTASSFDAILSVLQIQ